jgi:hypothetical protein
MSPTPSLADTTLKNERYVNQQFIMDLAGKR